VGDRASFNKNVKNFIVQPTGYSTKPYMKKSESFNSKLWSALLQSKRFNLEKIPEISNVVVVAVF
jgi:hypothetical protein